MLSTSIPATFLHNSIFHSKTLIKPTFTLIKQCATLTKTGFFSKKKPIIFAL